MKLIDGEMLSKGEPMQLKGTGETGRIVYVSSVHPFEGDVVVLVEK